MNERVEAADLAIPVNAQALLAAGPERRTSAFRAYGALAPDNKVTLIVKSIVSLAHDLNIRVNAEGIETEAQMEMMREYGCDELQGFLLGRPGRVDVHRQSRGVPTPRPYAARTDFASLSTMPAPLTMSGRSPN